ncbi:MAG TPA: patatin-like phospholipase family protein [Gemmatimonadales bacterium]|nr:patatin-like phospholipase family protein [Gemmatimonadales bacterium]
MKPERVSLALSGGGMKAMAHVGVVRALAEAGIEPVEIVAVSAGALVAALVAGGLPYERIVALVTRLHRDDLFVLNRLQLMVRGVAVPGLLKPEPLRSWLATNIPERQFERLRVPLRIGVVNLDEGRLEVFGSQGRTDCGVDDAVYASMALPMYLPPAVLGGATYADGGLLQVLPLELVTEGSDCVVAVDVGPAEAGHPSWRTLAPALVALSDRVTSLMMADQKRRTIEAWRADPTRPPLVLVEPDVDPYGTFSFDSTVDFIEAGYRAAHAALAARRSRGAGQER